MEKKKTTAIKAIRLKCLDCGGGSMAEVRLCDITHCPLHPFRLGKNPNIGKRQLTEEQIAAMQERLAAAREKKLANRTGESDGVQD